MDAMEAQGSPTDFKHTILKQEIFQRFDKFQISIESSFQEFMQSKFLIRILK
jgi:hypothetical protein